MVSFKSHSLPQGFISLYQFPQNAPICNLNRVSSVPPHHMETTPASTPATSAVAIVAQTISRSLAFSIPPLVTTTGNRRFALPRGVATKVRPFLF